MLLVVELTMVVTFFVVECFTTIMYRLTIILEVVNMDR